MRQAINEVVEAGAESTAEDAKRNLERNASNEALRSQLGRKHVAAKSTGTLASQIEVKASKFGDGGYIVEAQGAGNYDIEVSKTGKVRRRYYASFVELGTSKMEGLGYLRKALRRNKFRMRALLRRKLEAEIRNQ